MSQITIKDIVCKLNLSASTVSRALRNHPDISLETKRKIVALAGYTIMVCQSNESDEREVLNTQALLSHRVAGLIMSISQETRKIDHLQSVVRRAVPLVLFDRVSEAMPVSKVVVDDYQGAYQATTHLIQRAYKIGMAAGNLLLEEIQSEAEDPAPTVKTFPTRLIVRQST